MTCVAICSSLETFLRREENLKQGLLADDFLLSIIKLNQEETHKTAALSKHKNFHGVPITELAKTIRTLLSGFSPEERRMLILRFNLNWAFQDIAAEMKMKRRQKAHYKLTRILNELRNYLKKIYEI